jgi:hypothetical protein
VTDCDKRFKILSPLLSNLLDQFERNANSGGWHVNGIDSAIITNTFHVSERAISAPDIIATSERNENLHHTLAISDMAG